MNRRSFFAFLIGAPLAAVTGLKTKVFPDGVKMWPIHRVILKPAEWAKAISDSPFPKPDDERTWDYEAIWGTSRDAEKRDYTFRSRT